MGEAMNRILVFGASVLCGLLPHFAAAENDGSDEEIAQLASKSAPPLSGGFTPAPIEVPDGFSVQLAAGPPLLTHPTMA